MRETSEKQYLIRQDVNADMRHEIYILIYHVDLNQFFKEKYNFE